MSTLIELVKFAMWFYAYCTDFLINLANITNLSYYEINFIIFILIYPGVLSLLFVIYGIQRLRLNMVRNLYR